MTIFEELTRLLNESFAKTLKEKILYCLGYLEGDDENLDLYNLFQYMLSTEKDSHNDK